MKSTAVSIILVFLVLADYSVRLSSQGKKGKLKAEKAKNIKEPKVQNLDDVLRMETGNEIAASPSIINEIARRAIIDTRKNIVHQMATDDKDREQPTGVISRNEDLEISRGASSSSTHQENEVVGEGSSQSKSFDVRDIKKLIRKLEKQKLSATETGKAINLSDKGKQILQSGSPVIKIKRLDIPKSE